MVVSSSEAVTRTMRGQPKWLLETRGDETPLYMFWFRFIAEMFSAYSAVFFFCSFGCSLFGRLFGLILGILIKQIKVLTTTATSTMAL